jgi:hypothetical protein
MNHQRQISIVLGMWLGLAAIGWAETPSRLDQMGPEWQGNAISYSGFRD